MSRSPFYRKEGDPLSHIDTCLALFAKHGLNFTKQLEWNYLQGFVFSTPTYFIMGRPIADDPRAPGGAWFIEAMAGDTRAVWAILPYELPWIGWERFDSRLRFHRLEDVRRLTATKHEMAFTD